MAARRGPPIAGDRRRAPARKPVRAPGSLALPLDGATASRWDCSRASHSLSSRCRPPKCGGDSSRCNLVAPPKPSRFRRPVGHACAGLQAPALRRRAERPSGDGRGDGGGAQPGGPMGLATPVHGARRATGHPIQGGCPGARLRTGTRIARASGRWARALTTSGSPRRARRVRRRRCWRGAWRSAGTTCASTFAVCHELGDSFRSRRARRRSWRRGCTAAARPGRRRGGAQMRKLRARGCARPRSAAAAVNRLRRAAQRALRPRASARRRKRRHQVAGALHVDPVLVPAARVSWMVKQAYLRQRLRSSSCCLAERRAMLPVA